MTNNLPDLTDPKLLPCTDTPDTHDWTGEQIELHNGNGEVCGMSRTCAKCGLDAMTHTMRVF